MSKINPKSIDSYIRIDVVDTLYVENIEEREDAGTPPIIQKVRTALAFWVKEFITHKVIERMEHTSPSQTCRTGVWGLLGWEIPPFGAKNGAHLH
ncbi:hypothetical protein RND71_022066 [Anisodus tanguticus]|uniref:Uncharacterized protein n=1 Tax=Anisodus tanguticus TaxID=243964 RepID=A0AAE1RZC1_9SOLA|nr:hypothetical protein RND71_022066 [Anisodus tanguticus]